LNKHQTPNTKELTTFKYSFSRLVVLQAVAAHRGAERGIYAASTINQTVPSKNPSRPAFAAVKREKCGAPAASQLNRSDSKSGAPLMLWGLVFGVWCFAQ
jgi:hypothetical protein